MNERLGFTPLPWPQTAVSLGFSLPAGDGADGADQAAGLCALNGFTLRPEGDWLALVDRTPVSQAPPCGGLGDPGLWRVVQDGASLARIHDLPQLHGAQGVCDEDGAPSRAALVQLVEWATTTLHAEPRQDWTPPEREEVESWFKPALLRVRSGSLLAKGELVHEPQRLAFVFPELAVVPESLSSARASWLAGLLLDAQGRWRLVRFGIDAHTRRVQAEVDLTGVPSLWAPSIVQLSLEALQRAVEWVLAPLTFLADTSAASRALERHSFQSLNRNPSS